MDRSVTPSPGPRSPGRPREFDLDLALDKAIGAFSENGYHATPLGKLTVAMEIAEGSLYKAFRDKRGVFLAAFERYVMLRGERLARELAGARTGRDKVRAILAVYAEYCHGKTGKRGCLVVGSAVDLASSDRLLDDIQGRARSRKYHSPDRVLVKGAHHFRGRLSQDVD